MRRRVLALAVLAVCPIGCTRNYYYGQGPTLPLCDPPVTSGPTVITQQGDVCAVPNSGSGSQIALSQPQGAKRSSGSSSASRSSGSSSSYWRRPDPESMASTRIEGSLSDDAAVR
jgi:hypothetical protein